MSDEVKPLSIAAKKSGVTIADGVMLSLSVVTSRLGIFGVSGSGKTYTASVIAEEILAAHAHLVVIDPLGVWWGLRAGDDRTGGKPRFPVYIFGGEHADLPLYPTPESAAAVAEIIAAERISVILDLSEWEPQEQTAFAGRFARALYRAQATVRRAIHCIVDEADIFAPETPGSSAEWECRRSWDTVVRRGRVRGIGVSLISQRPAVVAKNLLTQIGTLIVHRITAAQDRQAIDGWFRSNGSEAERKAVLASLATLPVGEAWLWSPSDFARFERIGVRRRTTFDSSATPQVGQADEPLPAPRPLTALNVSALRARLEAASLVTNTDVPPAATTRFSPTTRKSEAVSVKVVEKIVTVERVVPVLSDEAAAQLQAALTRMASLQEELTHLTSTLKPLLSLLPNAPQSATVQVTQTANPPSVKLVASKPVAVIRSSLTPVSASETTPLQRGATRILQMLARYPKQRLSHAQIGTLTRLTPSGGTYQKYMAHLRQSGCVTTVENGWLQITEAGMAALGRRIPPEPHTVEEVLALWQPALRRREFEILQHLVAIRPRSLPVAELADTFRLSAAGGAFGMYLGTLRRNGLIAVKQGIAAVGASVP